MLRVVVGCGGNKSETAPASRTMDGSAAGVQAPGAPPPSGPADDSTKVKVGILTTGRVRMTVKSPTEAADKFVTATVGAGGHVDSRSEQAGHGRPTVDLTLR